MMLLLSLWDQKWEELLKLLRSNKKLDQLQYYDNKLTKPVPSYI